MSSLSSSPRYKNLQFMSSQIIPRLHGNGISLRDFNWIFTNVVSGDGLPFLTVDGCAAIGAAVFCFQGAGGFIVDDDGCIYAS